VSQVSGRVRVAGVDGWRGNWVVALVGDRVEWAVAGSAAAVVNLTADCAAVAVDVPIGLADGSGGRLCDTLAKKFLPVPAKSSVFPAPLRRTLDADSHAKAVEIAHAAGLPGMSIQAWNLVPGIRDWDAVLTGLPELNDRIVECHPEVSFRALAPERHFARKVTGLGVAHRLAALAPWVDAVGALRDLPDGPPVADALDALACAWTACRWATRTAVSLPAEAPRDDCGPPMRIVY
jgi:predicted RNase H-like nuclease